MNEKLKDAQELYELVLEGASHFLRNAKAFEIHILRGHNPSYEEIAEIMGSLASFSVSVVQRRY